LIVTTLSLSGPDKMYSGHHMIVFLLGATCVAAQIFRLPEQEACENSKWKEKNVKYIKSVLKKGKEMLNKKGEFKIYSAKNRKTKSMKNE
jgi:hypothetical protein